MDRPRQPAMPPGPRGTRRGSDRSRAADRSQARADRQDARRNEQTEDPPNDGDRPDEQTRGVRALLHGFAVTRWILLTLAVGFGIAAVIAIALAALFALVNSSV